MLPKTSSCAATVTKLSRDISAQVVLRSVAGLCGSWCCRGRRCCRTRRREETPSCALVPCQVGSAFSTRLRKRSPSVLDRVSHRTFWWKKRLCSLPAAMATPVLLRVSTCECAASGIIAETSPKSPRCYQAKRVSGTTDRSSITFVTQHIASPCFFSSKDDLADLATG